MFVWSEPKTEPKTEPKPKKLTVNFPPEYKCHERIKFYLF